MTEETADHRLFFVTALDDGGEIAACRPSSGIGSVRSKSGSVIAASGIDRAWICNVITAVNQIVTV
jgi:hypothetical protein